MKLIIYLNDFRYFLTICVFTGFQDEVLSLKSQNSKLKNDNQNYQMINANLNDDMLYLRMFLASTQRGIDFILVNPEVILRSNF